MWCFDVSAFLVNSFGDLGLVLLGLAVVSMSWSVRTEVFLLLECGFRLGLDGVSAICKLVSPVYCYVAFNISRAYCLWSKKIQILYISYLSSST